MTEEEIKQMRAEQFPQLEDCIYLSHCRIGVPPAVTLEAVRDFINGQCLRRGEAVVNLHEKDCIREASRLINAEEDEVGLLRSTSEGMGAFSSMLDLRPGDSVILNDLEFMSNIIPWRIMEREKGITLKIVHHHEGRLRVSDIKKAVDDRTRVIVISSVQEVNGFRSDIGAIGRLARRHGILFMVDAIQHLGALSLDVKGADIDILIAGGHKWLLSPFGTGVYFVRKALIPRMKPIYLGWRNVEEDNWRDYGDPAFSPTRSYSIRGDSAKRFMISVTDIIPGVPALWRSLRFINDVGIHEIEKRIGYLVSVLCDELKGCVRILSPLDERHRSGILTVRTESDQGITERLAERRIYVSRAYASGTGGIRIAPHFFNTVEEVVAFSRELKGMV